MKRYFPLLMTLFIVFVISSQALYCEVKLPAIFSDNMVLQQQTDAAIWGTATKNATVKVSTSWNNKSYSAKAYLTGGNITIFCPSVNEPVAVRYAFSDFIVGDLFNTEGLPASSFRTDTWE